MSEAKRIDSRKADHIRINLEENVQSALSTGLEKYRFQHAALPEINLADVDTGLDVFSRRLKAPILISSMTGGTGEAEKINLILAEAAQATGVALGLGSARVAIEQPDRVKSFQVRRSAPDILLFANLGAVQLNNSYGVDECKRAVEMIGADALILHLNPLQEALQTEGDTNFRGLLEKIAFVCQSLQVPVIVKEVGWGISTKIAMQLKAAGVAAIDVAGAGGTSWSQVEMHRIADDHLTAIAAEFRGWGIPTAESILQVRECKPGILIFASGGLRNGIDIAKSIALGADLGGMAVPFLKAAVSGINETVERICEIQRTIQICMFASGISTIQELQNYPLERIK
jgi:isopentenyl-diphosphate Delta-isomerase